MPPLLNGCSYGAAWTSFPGINISIGGGSFYRSVRTTMEFCATFGNPSAVLIPITFIGRDEYITTGGADRLIEGPYTESNSTEELRLLNIAFQMLDPIDYAAHDKFYVGIAMFSSWLEQQQIPYLMWNQCNKLEREHALDRHAVNKLKYVTENKNIIDIFDFCANEYIHQNGGQLDDASTNIPQYTHYTAPEYSTILAPFLNNYIQENNIDIPDLTERANPMALAELPDPVMHAWHKT